MEICILGISVINLSFYTFNNVRDSFWVLGDSFIRKFYTVSSIQGEAKLLHIFLFLFDLNDNKQLDKRKQF